MSKSTTLDWVTWPTSTWLKGKRRPSSRKIKLSRITQGVSGHLAHSEVTGCLCSSGRGNVTISRSSLPVRVVDSISSSRRRIIATRVVDSIRSTRGRIVATAVSDNNCAINFDSSSSSGDDLELKKTQALVESAMFAAVAGLLYFLSSLFRLEAYFGCFLPLPIVISSVRWGALAGGKTMVTTTLLLFVLSGPFKATSYLLMHGLVGMAMGGLWRWGLRWGLSLAACTLVRGLGVMGVISLSSWLLRENILALIIINAHASFSYILAALGATVVPTIQIMYWIFAAMVLVNCGTVIFLLHILYAVLFRRMGIRMFTVSPPWIERALDGNDESCFTHT